MVQRCGGRWHECNNRVGFPMAEIGDRTRASLVIVRLPHRSLFLQVSCQSTDPNHWRDTVREVCWKSDALATRGFDQETKKLTVKADVALMILLADLHVIDVVQFERSPPPFGYTRHRPGRDSLGFPCRPNECRHWSCKISGDQVHRSATLTRRLPFLSWFGHFSNAKPSFDPSRGVQDEFFEFVRHPSFDRWIHRLLSLETVSRHWSFSIAEYWQRRFDHEHAMLARHPDLVHRYRRWSRSPRLDRRGRWSFMEHHRWYPHSVVLAMIFPIEIFSLFRTKSD